MSATDVNVLLLGESGVGKSTFINAFANYNQFVDFKTALASNLVCLIPTSFTIADEDYNYTLVQLGEDGNEDCNVGESATQEPKEYKFQVDGQTVCLIDTPGVGDSRGLEQDEKNIRNIITYIQRYQHLNAICFLLKPNESILTEYFRFCITQLFSCLPKSAAANIVFVFTNTRSTCYRPAETMPVLKSLLKKMREATHSVNIPCSIKNVFCVDNEAFRFLVALKRGMKFSQREREDFSESWKTSAECCRRMLQHTVTSLKPHQLQEATSMNEAKNIVQLLCPLLLTMYVTYEENASKLQMYTANSPPKKVSTVTYLKETVKIPKSGKKKANYIPLVVCRNAGCCKQDYTHHIYKQICHMNCSCINFDVTVKSCCVFHGKKCKLCGCDSSHHTAIRAFVNVPPEMKTDEEKSEIVRIRNYQAALESEIKLVVQMMAKFSHFVTENSMGRNAVSFAVFMEDTIKNEQRLGDESNLQHLKYYKKLQEVHATEKQKLDMALAKAKTTNNDLAVTVVSHEEVRTCMEELLKLKITGAILSECKLNKDPAAAATKILRPSIDRTNDKFDMVTISDIDNLQRVLTENDLSFLNTLTEPCRTLISNMSVVQLISFVKEYLKQMDRTESDTHNISTDLNILDNLLMDIDLNKIDEMKQNDVNRKSTKSENVLKGAGALEREGNGIKPIVKTNLEKSQGNKINITQPGVIKTSETNKSLVIPTKNGLNMSTNVNKSLGLANTNDSYSSAKLNTTNGTAIPNSSAKANNSYGSDISNRSAKPHGTAMPTSSKNDLNTSINANNSYSSANAYGTAKANIANNVSAFPNSSIKAHNSHGSAHANIPHSSVKINTPDTVDTNRNRLPQLHSYSAKPEQKDSILNIRTEKNPNRPPPQHMTKDSDLISSGHIKAIHGSRIFNQNHPSPGTGLSGPSSKSENKTKKKKGKMLKERKKVQDDIELGYDAVVEPPKKKSTFQKFCSFLWPWS